MKERACELCQLAVESTAVQTALRQCFCSAYLTKSSSHGIYLSIVHGIENLSPKPLFFLPE